jgi:hypothetical protein
MENISNKNQIKEWGSSQIVFPLTIKNIIFCITKIQQKLQEQGYAEGYLLNIDYYGNFSYYYFRDETKHEKLTRKLNEQKLKNNENLIEIRKDEHLNEKFKYENNDISIKNDDTLTSVIENFKKLKPLINNNQIIEFYNDTLNIIKKSFCSVAIG